eukprot:10385599-Ditylum_brightwellii.AAC.1
MNNILICRHWERKNGQATAVLMEIRELQFSTGMVVVLKQYYLQQLQAFGTRHTRRAEVWR